LQAERLRALVRFAAERSPFYREHYRDVDLTGPFARADLPPVDKALLMERFDDWTTDRRLRRSELEAVLADDAARELHLGEYRVCATGGTSGRRGIFVSSR